eukprot:s214_g29.t1
MAGWGDLATSDTELQGHSYCRNPEPGSPREGLPPEDPRWHGVSRLFLANIPPTVTRQEFLDFVLSMGAPEPQRLRYPVFSNGKSRGFAWANFLTAEEALNFVRAVHDRHLPNFTGRKALACLPYNKTLGLASKEKSLSSLEEPGARTTTTTTGLDDVAPDLPVSDIPISRLAYPEGRPIKSRNKIPLEYRTDSGASASSSGYRQPMPGEGHHDAVDLRKRVQQRTGGWQSSYAYATERPSKQCCFPRGIWCRTTSGRKEYCNPKMPKIDWTDVHTVSVTPKMLWNEVTLASATIGRFVRFTSPTGNCQLTEMQVIGQLVAPAETCQVAVRNVRGTTGPGLHMDLGRTAWRGGIHPFEEFLQVFTPWATSSDENATVTFSLLSTPTVTAISPSNGTARGGTEVTISGSNFGSAWTTGARSTERGFDGFGEGENPMLEQKQKHPGGIFIAVVWRCPCQCPWDMEIWECKDPGDIFGEAVPENAVVVSGVGYANSRTAGGDFDGDLNMLSFHPTLMWLVLETMEEVSQFNIENMEEEVKAELVALQKKREEDIKEQQAEDLAALFQAAEPRRKADIYLKHTLRLPAPKLRGWACAMAERLNFKSVQSRQQEDTAIFSRAALCAHKAMDGPKHYLAHTVVKMMNSIVTTAGIAETGLQPVHANFQWFLTAPSGTALVVATMPAKVPGTHEVTVLPSFCDALAGEVNVEEVEVLKLRRELLTVETTDLQHLSSKALTLLPQGRHTDKEFKVRRKAREKHQ